jgi:hypothetical protein
LNFYTGFYDQGLYCDKPRLIGLWQLACSTAQYINLTCIINIGCDRPLHAILFEIILLAATKEAINSACANSGFSNESEESDVDRSNFGPFCSVEVRKHTIALFIRHCYVSSFLLLRSGPLRGSAIMMIVSSIDAADRNTFTDRDTPMYRADAFST